MKNIAAILIAACGSLLSQEVEPSSLPLLPYPKETRTRDGFLTPGDQLHLRHTGPLDELARTCVADLTAIGFEVSHGAASPENGSTLVELSLKEGLALGEEGYRMEIADSISISAGSETGLFWATRTVLQLLHAGPGEDVPRLLITDQPEFRYRGLMVDNARSFHSMDFHIETIKRLASFKLNRYQIHFSDHESYTLPSEAFPELPTKGRNFSREDIRKLMEVSRKYHVAIVPEIDVPGHASALLRGVEGLECGSGGGKLCIGREKTYQVLEILFSEAMGMMPGAYWHLGADEVHYSAKGCDHCAARIKQENLEDGHQLFNYFINRMHGFVRGRDRRMLVWEGFSPSLEPAVDKDVIVCPFDVKHSGRMPADYLKAGYTLLNTSWTPLYVADKIYMTTPEIISRWSPHQFGAGRSPQPLAYWKRVNPETYPDAVIGGQMCSWALEEKAEHGLLFGTGPGFPDYGRPGARLPIMAERLWTGSKTSSKDLLERAGESYWK